MTDAELIRAAQIADAFGELYRRHSPSSRALQVGLLRGRGELGRDGRQAALSLRRFRRDGGSGLPWLCGISATSCGPSRRERIESKARQRLGCPPAITTGGSRGQRPRRRQAARTELSAASPRSRGQRQAPSSRDRGLPYRQVAFLDCSKSRLAFIVTRHQLFPDAEELHDDYRP